MRARLQEQKYIAPSGPGAQRQDTGAHKKAARALDQAWAWSETGRRAQASGRLARAPLVSVI